MDGVADLAATSEFTARFVVRPPSDEDDTSPPPTPPAPQQIEVKALGVNPLDFRPLTPDVTAQEPGVWQRLLEGDVVVRHDVAQKLGLELGETYRLLGPDGEIDARIGAFASNGAPPLAEVLVPWTLSAQLGAGEPNLLVVGADDDADPSALGDAIVAAIGGGEVSVRDAPEEQRAQLVGTGRFDFQPFDYTDLGDGMIVIDPAWVQRWITTISLPGIGTTRCHRVMVPQLLKALEEIRAAGLYGHFKPEQFGGCYMPRHIDWDPTKPLSMHAWGLAIDFNTHDNWLGHTPTMDPRIVEIFERWGFEWGGRWARPDGMHFELDRVIEVDG
ncbi:MAG: M15 family metallopeptidase [Nitriliruptorales bacterium]|nr:M15 family metallopeptidase [Nitriliruptorales bacterium]